MKLSKGSIYRLGQSLKDFGERLGHRKLTAWFCRPVIKLGYLLRDSVKTCPISEL